jgi:putative transposase
MAPQRYPTDLTDDEWRLLEPLIPPAMAGGRPRSADAREVVNAIRYLLRSGCAWRLLPREFPPWPTVYAYFRRWQADGTWERSAGVLRRELRAALGRRPEPSAAVLDSQTVKTTEKGGLAATTAASGPRGASATSSSTRRAS